MLGPHTIRVRRTALVDVDEYGDPLSGGPVSEFDVAGCSVQPGVGGEYADAREASTTVYTVWAALEPRILDTDHVVWDGVEFEVDGSVGRWAFGRGHQVIPLKVVTG